MRGFWEKKKICWAKEGQSGTRGGFVTNECRLEVGQQQHGQFDTNSGSMVSSRDERIDRQNTESCPVFFRVPLCPASIFRRPVAADEGAAVATYSKLESDPGDLNIGAK